MSQKQPQRQPATEATLLREVHHRVKNHFQLVASLLYLQTRHTDNEQASLLLQASQNRIKALSLIHEQVYYSGDFRRIDCRDYFSRIVSYLVQTYNPHPVEVVVRLEVDKIMLDIDRVAPCGLVVTELVTRVLQAAFPPSLARAGSLALTFREAGEGFELVVADNGLPHTRPGDLAEAASLGLQLAVNLVAQLRGELRLEQDGRGSKFCIQFPKQ